jgi:CRISP-associated protein Cas1
LPLFSGGMMTLLVVDRADVELECEGNALVVREGDRRSTLPLKQVTRAVLQGSGMRLQLSVLQKLAEQGATTLILSARRTRRIGLLLGNAHNDARLRLAQALQVMDAERCLAWGRFIVGAKLRRQSRTVGKWLAARPDARRELLAQRAAIDGGLARIRDAMDAETLRGIEGAAARAHFKALAAVLPPALGFCGRNRRPPRDPANAALSLGYTLLHSEAVHALHAVGLDPLLGFYHRPAYGRESLASDLMEPLRPTIDEWVWRMFADRYLREDHFTRDGDACLLGKAGRGAYFSAWATHRQTTARWLLLASRRMAASVAQDAPANLVAEEGSDDD